MVDYDEFGPEKMVTSYNPKAGLKAYTVIDNTVFGPGKGGVRMTPTVTLEEVVKLARTMTWKNSLAGIPFGGAKSGIIADTRKISVGKKHELVKAFAKALKNLSPAEYITAPDINMGEKEMQIFAEENGNPKSCTGKPASMGGLPHELGSTGFGVYHATKVAAEHIGLDLNGARVAVEGFGNVGSFVSKYLTEKEGAKLVGVSDIRGCIHNPNGLDYSELMKATKEAGSVTKYADGKKLFDSDLFELDVDIIVTAAVPNVITAANIHRVKAKLIVEGSNIPISPEIEDWLHRKKITVIPDFVANAGGVISSYVEHIGGTEKEMFKMVEEKIVKNTKEVLEDCKEKDAFPRGCAMDIARKRIRKKEKQFSMESG